LKKNNSYFTFTKNKYVTHINQNSIIRKNFSKLATMMHNFMQRLSYYLTEKNQYLHYKDPKFRKISGIYFEKYTKPMTIFCKYNIKHFIITALTVMFYSAHKISTYT
jgi:hypothetical protein